ncbi:MAG: hypothetical protein H6622_16810 [Halobacteriovoraceae bacterium]|nr:hypothetical protein [Halobacteriovoraceae bacterium]
MKKMIIRNVFAIILTAFLLHPIMSWSYQLSNILVTTFLMNTKGIEDYRVDVIKSGATPEEIENALIDYRSRIIEEKKSFNKVALGFAGVVSFGIIGAIFGGIGGLWFMAFLVVPYTYYRPGLFTEVYGHGFALEWPLIVFTQLLPLLVTSYILSRFDFFVNRNPNIPTSNPDAELDPDLEKEKYLEATRNDINKN